ncbi:MAG: flavodoxin family protein [Spirochaetes bacterium]|nr:flavodoxin family protein [Spirochaetota bacterium]
MMKVIAFIGSNRKKYTYVASERFLKNLQSLGNIDCEIIVLSDYNLQICKGCRVCLDKGEEFCPLKDDRDLLIDKIINSDGVLFATPNYSFHVSGIMKVFLDRFGYLFHRPRMFSKTFTSIVAQGLYGGKVIIKYFNFIGEALGFNVVKGIVMTTVEPMSDKRQLAINKDIDNLSRKFYKQLVNKEYPKASLKGLMAFRMGRSSIKTMLDEKWRDYQFYKDKGWFESNYYYKVKMSSLKKVLGKLFDKIGKSLANNS